MDLPASFSVSAPEYDDGKCSLREAVQTANTNQPINATNEAGDPDDDDQPDCVVGSGSGDVSNAIPFSAAERGANPTPSLSDVSEAPQLGGPIALTLRGSGFVAGAEGRWNGHSTRPPLSAPPSCG